MTDQTMTLDRRFVRTSSSPPVDQAEAPLWSPAGLPPAFKVVFDTPDADAEAVEVDLAVAHVVAGSAWVGGGDVAVPVQVRIEGCTDGTLVAVHPGTGIHGVGEDLATAINDLRDALVEHRDFLMHSQPLSADLQEHLTFLERHLRPGE